MRRSIWIILLLPAILLTSCNVRADELPDPGAAGLIQDENSCRDQRCWPTFTAGALTGCITPQAAKEAASDLCERKVDAKGDAYLWCGDEDGQYWEKHEKEATHPETACGTVTCRRIKWRLRWDYRE